MVLLGRNFEVLQPKVTRNTPDGPGRYALAIEGEGHPGGTLGSQVSQGLGLCEGVLNRNSGSGSGVASQLELMVKNLPAMQET